MKEKTALEVFFIGFLCLLACNTTLCQTREKTKIEVIGDKDSLESFIKKTDIIKYPIKDTIKLKHSPNAIYNLDDFIKEDFVMLFQEPEQATLIFNNYEFKKSINYNMIYERLVFKEGENDYSTIDYSPPPDSIHVKGKSFILTKKGAILERIQPSSTNYYISYESVCIYKRGDDPEGFTDIKSKFPTGSVTMLYESKKESEITTIICEAKPVLYFFNGKRFKKVIDEKKFLSTLDEIKQIKASLYLKSNHISFNNVDDLYSFVGHIFGEYSPPVKESSLVERVIVQDPKPIIPKEIELNVAKKDSILKHELNKYMGKMLTNNQISENVETTVVTSVVQEKNELGEEELNLQIEYGYRVIKASIENQTDDYPAGKYRLVNSNAAKITCQILKQTLENDLQEFLLPDTRVSIKITGSTDGTPISNSIPYDDAFGDINGISYFVNNNLENVTITQETGITTNQQLAFLRTYGVRQFIETFVEPLQFTKNTFSHYAVVHNELGAEYRRITVKFTIHNAFDNQKPDIPKQLEIESIPSVSDVDVNIPQSMESFPNKFAIIIGNEDYSSRQSGLGSESNVAFAVRDAEVFKSYCIKTLGLEERNVFMVTNATSAEMNQKIDLVTQIVQRIGNVTDLYFYYAGHGFPDEVTREPYLMPVDVSASYLQAAVKLSDVYKKLSESEAERVTVFLDACFSGGGREAGLLAARAVKVRPKEEVIKGNLVVFSATSDDQSALPFKEKKHGMFTYFLLKKLQQTNGDIDYGSLDAYLSKFVSVESLRVNSKAQDPKTSVSFDARDVWKEWKFK